MRKTKQPPEEVEEQTTKVLGLEVDKKVSVQWVLGGVVAVLIGAAVLYMQLMTATAVNQTQNDRIRLLEKDVKTNTDNIRDMVNNVANTKQAADTSITSLRQQMAIDNAALKSDLTAQISSLREEMAGWRAEFRNAEKR